MSEVHRSAYLK
ncbi:hypothetical protein F383_21100 [Gossypium arboreum]|uniref:Uncharacterized protein n=1 Tax=Gossypium arboreum TaxID=29729 RepID=A0A0B0NX48_GOSAR|nr:hypothetical protein F383_21100 [Gossypium arboreum]